MSEEKRKRIASAGGTASGKAGGHRWTEEQAREASRKGVLARRRKALQRKRAQESGNYPLGDVES
jgi:hypothetical protein